MALQDVALGLGGIAVSVVTFAIGYRQTIGARQARAQAADEAVVDMLLRRLVLEQLELSTEEVQRAVNGKAIEQRPAGVGADAIDATSGSVVPEGA